MKRLEAHERAYEPFRLEIIGRTDDEISYHVKLLGQAGLLEVYATPRIDTYPLP